MMIVGGDGVTESLNFWMAASSVLLTEPSRSTRVRPGLTGSELEGIVDEPDGIVDRTLAVVVFVGAEDQTVGCVPDQELDGWEDSRLDGVDTSTSAVGLLGDWLMLSEMFGELKLETSSETACSME